MEPGQLLGSRYRLDVRVDGGGMGDVWRGHDIRLDRTVAIKVLHSGLSSDTTFRQRFHGEARAVAALQAPGVVNLFDYGEDTTDSSGIVSYLVMELVPGESLRAILSEAGRMSPDAVLNMVTQSAMALDAAHRAGIIHRDVKPGNILINPDNDQVKIVDFGIARTRGSSPLTETGAIMGSVSYVSPEQLYGQELTGVSDVYSLGIVAYECLTGVKPFPGDVPATVIAEQLHKSPPALPEDVPADIASVIMRALEKDPANRWPSAAAFAAACRQLQTTGPIQLADEADATAIVPIADHTPTQRIAKPASPRASSPSTRNETPRECAQARDGEKAARGRTRILVVSTAVVALLAAGSLAAVRPWASEESGNPITAADSSSSSKTSDSSQTSADSIDDTGENPSQTPGESSSSKKSHTPSHSSPPSSSDDSSSPPETATVPDLKGLSEDAAAEALDAEGFTNYSSHPVGDGDVVCDVTEQSEPAGTETTVDTKISYGVQHVDDEADCATVGTETLPPDEQ